MNIGVFGGSFNPVHNQHVKIAALAVEKLKLNKLLIVPSNISPGKNQTDNSRHRLNMAELAFAKVKNIEVCDYEIKSGGESYTYLTIDYFKKKYPHDSLFFILGGDAFLELYSWKNPELIVKNAEIAVYERENSEIFNKALLDFKCKYNKETRVISAEVSDISSTKIRILISFGQDVSEYLDNDVCKYISDNNLYNENQYLKALNECLSKKRIKHTAYVTAFAMKYYRRLNLNYDDVFAACALHDISKEAGNEILLNYNKADNLNLPLPVIHAFYGAEFAKKEFGIENGNILNAIRYHTTGRAGMSDLEKLVFVADLLEDNRVYKDIDYLRKCVEKDFESGFRECVKEEYKHLSETKKPEDICALSRGAYEYYK